MEGMEQMSEIAKLITQIGLVGAITVVTVYFGSRQLNKFYDATAERETRMAARIEKLEDDYKDKLVGIIQANTAAMQAMATSLDRHRTG